MSPDWNFPTCSALPGDENPGIKVSSSPINLTFTPQNLIMLCVFLLMYSSAVVVRYSLTIPFKPSTSTKHHTRDGVRNSPTRDQSKGQCTDYLNLFQASDFHQLLQLNGCLPGSEIAICFVLCCGIGASANVKKPFRQRRATNSLTNEWPLLVLRIFIEMVQINVCIQFN